MADNENLSNNEKKVFEARPYQLELLEYICKKNAIIYLPTGSGKTYIAILALKRFSHQLNRTIGEGGKRAVFICNTIELSRQHALGMRQQTNFHVGLYIGERGVDSWTPSRWKTEIDEHQVLVGTAQTFLNIVQGNFMKISDMSIVIIDECHNGTKNHPMHEFMKAFKYTNPEHQPRVIGLTGVLVKGNKLTNYIQDIKALEATFLGNILTVRSAKNFDNVMIYSTKPKEILISYDTVVNEYQMIQQLIISKVASICLDVDKWDIGVIPPRYTKGMAQEREPNKKNYIKNLLKDFLFQLDDLGLYGASYAILNCIVDFEIKKRQSETLALRQLYRYMVTSCEFIRHTLLREMEKKLSDFDSQEGILTFSKPKLRTLLLLMAQKFAGREFKDICCLIFVDRRSSAKCLYNVIIQWVKVVPALKDIIKPSFMVGRNSSMVPNIENFLERKWSNKSIEDFRNGQCNMIVCSSVLEEGIDVQACNFVIAFDLLKTFNSYIQTKGRARKKDSEYIIFSPKINQSNTCDKIKMYTNVHNEIREFLCTRILNEDGPSKSDIAEQCYDKIKPFCISSGAYVTSLSALPLIHRYCQSLPNDAYGLVMPTFEVMPCPPRKYFVKIRLPPQSALKETITSDPMSNPRIAKTSAALKAVQKLYEIGELNDKLIPITKKECITKVSEQFFPYWKKHNTDVNDKKAGLNQQRNYKKLYPAEICNALPVEGKQCYAYGIKMIPDFENNEYSQHVHTLLLKHDTNYAILLRKPLPKLAEMQMFMSQGKIRVTISSTPITCVLERGQLESLIGFHTMIFRELLDLWQNRNFLVVDGRNDQNSMLIAPICNNNINWSLVNNFQHLSQIKPLSVRERKEKIYRPEDYVGSVVGKWYAPNAQQRFVVTRVRTDMTASSPFDMPQYESYLDFFQKRYESAIEQIAQPNQFMIEVRELTSRRNFFVNTKNKVNVNRDGCLIRLVPELCHNFCYPSDMWLKALLLPAVLQRTHYMLHAEHIRTDINKFLKLNNLKNFVSYNPAPLIIDPSLKRAIDIDGNASLDIQEIKSILNPLPAKSKNEYSKLGSITQELIWQEYLEPTDCKNQSSSIYPVEVDYFYKFISGLALNMENLSIDEEDLWQESQLNMPKKIAHQKSDFSFNNNYEHAIPSITDVPIEDKRRIKILELTFGQSEIKSAEQHEFLAALTTAASNDMFDMERFELLGDAFLKFSTAIYLIYKFPTWNEGFLTAVKSKVVSNRNLLYCMMEKDFAERIYGTLFRPNAEWLPPLVSLPANILDFMNNQPNLLNYVEPSSLFSLQLSDYEIQSGKCTTENLVKFKNGCTITAPLMNVFPKVDDGIQDYVYHQTFSDKTVADMLEAILGVCVKNYGIRHSFRMLEYFNIFHENNLEELLNRTLDSRTLRSNISQKDIDSYLINYQFLEKNLNYKFRDRSYLLQALTHPSYPTNRLTGCYQELEFMGDAILDFLISCYIYEHFQHLTPGKLTDLRAALVNNITLACVCVRHRFHLFMLAENAPLADAVKSFASFQDTQNHRVTQQVRILVEEPTYTNDDDISANNLESGCFNIAENVDVPKALGDIVEAIIGAVYLDSKDLNTTWNVIYHILEQEINDFSYDVPIDAVRSLMENTHAQPQFSDPVIDESAVMMKCEFRCLDETISVHGFGSNKIQAKKAAAKHALQILARHST